MKKIQDVIAKRQAVERQERRNRILNASRTVFFEKGYIGATMRDIALAAELSPGLIYHYFKNKDEIYAAICEEAFEVLLDLVRKAGRKEGPVQEQLIAVAGAYLSFYVDYPEYFEIISFKELGFKKVGLPEHSVRRLDQLSLESLTILCRLVEKGIAQGVLMPCENVWEMTFTLWASIEGIIFIHKRGYFETYGLSLEQVFARQLNFILEGIRKP